MKHTILSCGIMLTVTALAQNPNPLTLEQALALAHANAPQLQAAKLYSQAAVVAVDAAGRWDNPAVVFEAENVGGDLGLYDDATYTLAINQTFMRGGKQRTERIAAQHAARVVEYGSIEQQLELESDVYLAFAELFAQQEIGKVRAEQLELSRAFAEVARRRLDAGAGSELEVKQAELALDETLLAQTCCFGDLDAARVQLASLLGIPAETLPELAGAYYEVEAAGTNKVDAAHPTLVRLDAKADRVLAEAQRAKAQDVSDFTLGAGYRRNAASDINTFVFSASIPLSFNRRGQIEHAAGLLRVDAVRAQREAVRRRLQLELDRLTALHKGALMEATLTRDHLLPKAEEAYVLSRDGYEVGRYSWLELISAQQHLAEIRIRYIESLLAVHRIEADLVKFKKEIQ